MEMPRSTSPRSRPTLSLTRKTMLALIGCVIVGHLVAVPGGVSLMEPFRKKFFPGNQTTEDPYCKFNNRPLAFFGISVFVSGLPASSGSPFVTRKYGHRVSILCGATLAAAGTILEFVAPDRATLLAGRLAQGFGLGFLNQAVPSYLAEMAAAGWGGTSVCAVQVWAKAGSLLTNILNYVLMRYGQELVNYGWKLSLSAIPFPLAVILMCASVCVLPGTQASRQQETLNARAEQGDIIRAGPSQEITFIESLKLLCQMEYIPAVLTGLAVQVCIHLTGVNIVGPIMFQAMGFGPEDAILVEIISSLFSCVSTGIVIYYMDKLGRKTFLIAGGVLMFVSLFVLGVIKATGLGGGGAAHHGLCIGMVVGYAIGFGASWGPMGVLIPSEIYPSEIRSTGQAVSVTTSTILSFLIGYFYPPLLCCLRHWIIFVLAAAVSVVTGSAQLFLPETRGTTLEQLPRVWSRHWLWHKFIHQENGAELELELGNYMPDPGLLSDDTMDPPPLSQSKNGQNDAELELELRNMPDAGSLSEDTMDSSPLSQSNNGHDHIGDQPRSENNP